MVDDTKTSIFIVGQIWTGFAFFIVARLTYKECKYHLQNLHSHIDKTHKFALLTLFSLLLGCLSYIAVGYNWNCQFNMRLLLGIVSIVGLCRFLFQIVRLQHTFGDSDIGYSKWIINTLKIWIVIFSFTVLIIWNLEMNIFRESPHNNTSENYRGYCDAENPNILIIIYALHEIIFVILIIAMFHFKALEIVRKLQLMKETDKLYAWRRISLVLLRNYTLIVVSIIIRWILNIIAQYLQWNGATLPTSVIIESLCIIYVFEHKNSGYIRFISLTNKYCCNCCCNRQLQYHQEIFLKDINESKNQVVDETRDDTTTRNLPEKLSIEHQQSELSIDTQ